VRFLVSACTSSGRAHELTLLLLFLRGRAFSRARSYAIHFNWGTGFANKQSAMQSAGMWMVGQRTVESRRSPVAAGRWNVTGFPDWTEALVFGKGGNGTAWLEEYLKNV
jgi:hypothetical protein